MPVKTLIEDGNGTGQFLHISDEGAANVVVHPHPPKDDIENPLPLRQYLTDDGTTTGSTDMLVDGSSTNVEFWIPASEDFDIYIQSLSFIIADAGATLKDFGSINALTNGCKLSWRQTSGEIILHDNLVSNWEFVRMANGNPAFGSGTSAFRASNVVSTSEAFIPILDFGDVYGFPWGLKLRRGTTDRIVLTVRDNITAPDQFDCIATGICF